MRTWVAGPPDATASATEFHRKLWAVPPGEEARSALPSPPGPGVAAEKVPPPSVEKEAARLQGSDWPSLIVYAMAINPPWGTPGVVTAIEGAVRPVSSTVNDSVAEGFPGTPLDAVIRTTTVGIAPPTATPSASAFQRNTW